MRLFQFCITTLRANSSAKLCHECANVKVNRKECGLILWLHRPLPEWERSFDYDGNRLIKACKPQAPEDAQKAMSEDGVKVETLRVLAEFTP